jgi:hypothetical protein
VGSDEGLCWYVRQHQQVHEPVSFEAAGDLQGAGFAVAGGSDIALCSDMIVMAEDARIGYPPVRVWGCPTTAMWVYRLGAEKAKRMLFTGDKITGIERRRSASC